MDCAAMVFVDDFLNFSTFSVILLALDRSERIRCDKIAPQVITNYMIHLRMALRGQNMLWVCEGNKKLKFNILKKISCD
jgi:hypothetical protein